MTKVKKIIIKIKYYIFYTIIKKSLFMISQKYLYKCQVENFNFFVILRLRDFSNMEVDMICLQFLHLCNSSIFLSTPIHLCINLLVLTTSAILPLSSLSKMFKSRKSYVRLTKLVGQTKDSGLQRLFIDHWLSNQ